MKKFDLEDRLIDFTIRISNVVDEIDSLKLETRIKSIETAKSNIQK